MTKKKPVKKIKKKAAKPAAKKSAARRRAKSPGEDLKPDPKRRTSGGKSAEAAPLKERTAGGADARFASLPPKQQVFVTEYLANGFNATQAAVTAGYSARNADTQGSRLLANAKIAAIIAERTNKALKKREITAERVLDEIAKMAFFDPRRLFRADGSLIPIVDLDDETAASIAGMDVRELYEDKCPIGQLKKIKIADKGMSLERLGRYLKLFTDKVEHSGSLGVQLVTTVPRPQRALRAVLDASRKGKDECKPA